MAKKLCFCLATLVLLFFVFETIGYFTSFVFDDMYDHREEVLQEIEKDGLAHLKEEGIDPVLGWKTFGPRTTRDCNCQGMELEYSFDHNGARIYKGYNGEHAQIIVVGDSYSHGFEVSAEETFSAQLAEILGVSVANHGVGGYGPVQAFLNLKQKIERYPGAKVVILGIMYENVFRMVNSYRPVLTTKASVYGIKPYIKKGHIRPHPGNQVFKDIDSFKRHADEAFDRDFWAKPKHKFPFSVSFIRALGSNYFYFKRLPRKLRKAGVPEYFLTYRSDDFSLELVSLLHQYAKFAKEKDLTPVVVFIPRDRHDIKSVSRFIVANSGRFDKNLLVGDVGSADIDWDRYNLMDTSDSKNINFCHPSPYGHRKIAQYIAGLLRVQGVKP